MTFSYFVVSLARDMHDSEGAERLNNLPYRAQVAAYAVSKGIVPKEITPFFR